jgi:coenzyme F420-0:L-glutamate ligase
MPHPPLQVIPIEAPVKQTAFPLYETIFSAIDNNQQTLQAGDVLAISSKYVAISENRIVELDTVEPTDYAQELATRYRMDARIAQLVIQEAEHIFGGIQLGYLLTWRSGVIAPNAGLDRSNIPSGKVVLLPADPYKSAQAIRDTVLEKLGIRIGIVMTDSWLVPGRFGTTGVALASAGFLPIADERGKEDLFGNPMMVTQRGIADGLCVAAQLVMGERDEATPMVIIRGADIQLRDTPNTQDDVAIPWEMDIYIESLTLGLLPDGAPRESFSAKVSEEIRS